MSRLAQWFKDNFGGPDPACFVCQRPGHLCTCEPIGAATTPRPRPRIAAVNRAPTRDEFAAWRDEPVTQFVFAALRRAQQAQRDGWLVASWQGGDADGNLLTELRARADAYASLEEADYLAFCEWAGVEPERANA